MALHVLHHKAIVFSLLKKYTVSLIESIIRPSIFVNVFDIILYACATLERLKKNFHGITNCWVEIFFFLFCAIYDSFLILHFVNDIFTSNNSIAESKDGKCDQQNDFEADFGRRSSWNGKKQIEEKFPIQSRSKNPLSCSPPIFSNSCGFQKLLVYIAIKIQKPMLGNIRFLYFTTL